jgi:hypothetical protein
MHKIDMKTETTVALGIQATLSGTTPVAGNIVDVTDYQAATFLLQTATVTVAGTGGFSVRLQHSDTTAASDFEDVPAGQLLGAALSVTSDTADNVPIGSVGYRGSRRYVRAVGLGTSSTNAVIQGVWALQKPRYAPAASTAANITAT